MSDDTFAWWILPYAAGVALAAVICGIYFPPKFWLDAICRKIIRRWAKDQGWKIRNLRFDPMDHAVVPGPPYYMVHLDLDDGRSEWALIKVKSSKVEVTSWGKPLYW